MLTRDSKGKNKYTISRQDLECRGELRYVWPDGSRYKGEFIKGRLQGDGSFIWPDGSSYTGEWKDDLPHGQGIYTRSDGHKIKALWEEGRVVQEKEKLKPEIESRQVLPETPGEITAKTAADSNNESERKARLRTQAESHLKIEEARRQKDEAELRNVFLGALKKNSGKAAEDGKLKNELRAHLKEEAQAVLKSEEESCLRAEEKLKAEV
ncbi:MAG: hypothetical protein ABRQ33_07980, partial [Smithellaceae bacterium]